MFHNIRYKDFEAVHVLSCSGLMLVCDIFFLFNFWRVRDPHIDGILNDQITKGHCCDVRLSL